MSICPFTVVFKKSVLHSGCTFQYPHHLVWHLVICFLFPKEMKGMAEGVRNRVKYPFIILGWPVPLEMMLNLVTIRIDLK